MSRSLKKGPFVDLRLYQKVQKQQESGKSEPIKTWARSCTIVPEFVGVTFMVHNGKAHLKVLVIQLLDTSTHTYFVRILQVPLVTQV